MIDLDKDTRLALITKADRFKRDYSSAYWGSRKPTEKQRFINACIIIEELAGLVVNMLELEDLECV